MNTLLVLPLEGRGGVVSVAENLGQYLREQGHEVVFLHSGPRTFLSRETTPPGIRRYRLRLCYPFAGRRPIASAIAFPFLFPLALLQLLWLIRRERIDVVNLHFPIDNLFYFGLCRRLLPIRLVTSVHGSDVFASGEPKTTYSSALRFLLRSSDLIVLPSDAYRKKLVELFPEIRDRTVFIHNGINPAPFIAARNGRSDQARDPYILCIAYLMKQKGVDVLLRASESLLASDGRLRLIVVGEGPQRKELEDLASSLGIRNKTDFLGSRDETEVAALLNGCEVLVLPSRAESFGIVVVEAMTCRKPVVASAVGGVPEIIDHEVHGILVEPENPVALAEGIRRVLTDSALKTSLIENAHARALERFSFSRTGAAYQKAFHSLARPRFRI
jgi:glycosyltransferase involved in cell wall biosynthesis